MKRPPFRAILLLAALACLAHSARAQDEAGEERRMARWKERPGPVKDEGLKRELLRMYEEDQAVRAPMLEGRPVTEAERRAVMERDAADTKRLGEILDSHGFPSVKLVGIRATRAFITMLLHSPSLELQKRALPGVERAARRREIPPDDFVMLADHVLINEGEPQLYGTVFRIEDKISLWETRDPAHVDERRRKLGLLPLRRYAKFLAEMYKLPLDESSLPAPAKPRRR